MTSLFLELVNHISFKGKIKEAIMYETGIFSTLTVDLNGETFKISIIKEEKDANDND